MTHQQTPEPMPTETKDWTVVLDAGCSECGWAPFAPQDSAHRFADAATRWGLVLQRDDPRMRPAPLVWSPVEYAYHVRELLELLAPRIRNMVAQEDPTFQNYDGDASAAENQTWAADPAVVAREIKQATTEVLATLDALEPADWQRAGHRSDAVVFTVGSLCQFIVHDVEHHLWDVNG